LGAQIKDNEIGGACSKYGGRKGAHRVLVGRPEGMRTTGKPGRRWDDNIKMDFFSFLFRAIV